MSLSLVSGKSAFQHDGYIAVIENCYAPIAVKRTLFPTCVASLLLGASFNTIFATNICYLQEFFAGAKRYPWMNSFANCSSYLLISDCSMAPCYTCNGHNANCKRCVCTLWEALYLMFATEDRPLH